VSDVKGFLQEAEQIDEGGRPRVRSIKKIRFRMKPTVRPKSKMGTNEDQRDMPAGEMNVFRVRLATMGIFTYVVVTTSSRELGRRQRVLSR